MLTIRQPLLDRRGQRTDATLAQIERRNLLIAITARTFWPGTSSRYAAEQLSQALLRYTCGAWRRDRVAESCPARYHGQVQEHLFRILRTRDALLSARHIRRVIDDGLI
jgi:hypothetical protein